MYLHLFWSKTILAGAILKTVYSNSCIFLGGGDLGTLCLYVWLGLKTCPFRQPGLWALLTSSGLSFSPSGPVPWCTLARPLWSSCWCSRNRSSSGDKAPWTLHTEDGVATWQRGSIHHGMLGLQDWPKPLQVAALFSVSCCWEGVSVPPARWVCTKCPQCNQKKPSGTLRPPGPPEGERNCCLSHSVTW